MTEKPRKRGRPRRTVTTKSGEATAEVSREGVLDAAFEMTKTTRLSDVSFVQIAKKLGITPGSVHYHVGTRDQLTEVMITRLYQQVVEHVADNLETLSWDEALRQLLHFLKTELSKYPGIATHLATSSERHMFKPENSAGIDYGALYMDGIFRILKRAALNPENAAHAVHLCHQLVISSSFGELERSRPEDSRDFVLERASKYQRQAENYPGLVFGIEALATIDTERSFEIGVEMMISMVTSMSEPVGSVSSDS